MLKRTLPIVAAISIAITTMSHASTVFAAGHVKTNQFWWPDQLNLSPLRQHGDESNPYGDKFNYAKEFASLDLAQLKKDIETTLKDSKAWWPADWGHYGPLMIRMAWHSAGVYRVHDGRGGAAGGQQRFDPLNSWPDNANLDKARRLLWPVKQKYGRKISWADLMVLSGNVALESMGFKTFGFAGGRTDDWEPDLVYWGPETAFLADKRRDKKGKLKGPLAAVEMGLIYVNPVGPHGKPDPLLAAEDIRMSFGRMAMNDEEIVALIAGGHTLGKAHGAKRPDKCVGAEPAAAPIEAQGLGWKNKCGTGVGADTTTSGLEGAWTVTPTKWSSNYLDNLMNFNWVETKSPAGAIQWIPDNKGAANLVPDAHIPNKRHAPIMFTTDIALKEDPSFRKVVERFRKNPKEFDKAFAKAWFKLTHRDMGPRARYVGADVPSEVLSWQDPIPEVKHALVTESDIAALKKQIQASGLTTSELVRTAWAAASSHRVTDMRGGANGARIRLEPQVNWAVNNPKELKKVLNKLESVQNKFNKQSPKAKISLADMVVLAGASAIESAAKQAGYKVEVPFTPGRTDASQAQTNVKSFNYLKPKADGFRNYYTEDSYMSPAEMLVDKANLLGLNVPEMTVLVGGLRALNANYDGSALGVLTDKPGVLSNDFFVNLLDMSTAWTKSESKAGIYEGHDRASGKLKWQTTPVDLIFGSSSELRAIAEVYASDDADKKFIKDFVVAWVKVMKLDRFDLK
ncbi:catalase/peroxidase HPI [sulfur-oxidizing endosymbiont of Gigantopelta aegis]|uniref:catalase/peroxidase HPI n=1 Tax=sulfur-oxidizing endosymbiont of Gigantopelta aegis TaxID=2794934 RepID=UPI0018DB15B8|nr:catalase/peroxidase HPI [sulfur-oxidizing endosymbiont of Gigantopelta aegis]